MSGHRFYVGETLTSVAAGDEVEIHGAPAHRMVDVLRLRRGDGVLIFGAGREFEAILLADGQRVRVRLLDELPPHVCASPRLTVCQALIRSNRFEWLIEKGTELGVAAFVPVLTEHTAARVAEIGPARLERWRRIAVEATEQSGGRTPPAVAAPVRFEQALALAAPALVVAWERVRTPPQAAELARLRDAGRPGLSLFIGPEGGFSESEVARAQQAGATLIGLGPRILRAETAAIAAAALLLLG